MFQYAELLFRQGEYFRAVSEYKRLLYYFPRAPLRRAARIRIGEATLNGGEARQAVTLFSDLLDTPEMTPLQGELLFLRGLARLELERDTPYRLREEHIAAALSDLRALPPTWPGQPAAQAFVQAMEEPAEEIPSKSPWLAAGLSAVVPGSGSAYVGRYAEGALAFFVNAVFIWATVEAFANDDDDVGIVLGIGALAFYAGNIYAAANGAQKLNDRARADYLERQRLRFGIVPQPDGLAGVLRLDF